eukprot:IDg8840t1
MDAAPIFLEFVNVYRRFIQ